MLSRLAHIARIYGKLQVLHLRAHLEYEADFWIGILGVALTHTAGFIFIWTLFSRITEIKGWSLWEITFLYALNIIPRGLVEICCDGQWRLRLMVNLGEFDRVLVRPISPALQVITQISSIHGAGSVALGVAVLLRSVDELGVTWDAGRLLLLLATVANSVVLIGAIHFAINCVAFWDPGTSSSFPFLIAQFAEFGKFPITVYDRLVQFIITWILPFAFVSYYPGLVLLGKHGTVPWLGYMAPLAGPIMVLIASAIWRHSLQRYQGTGH